KTLSVTPVNDPPRLSATGLSPTFTEGSGAGAQGAAVLLFGSASADTVEAGQSLTGLTLTVSGLADGAAETLGIGGRAVALTNGASGTTGTGLAYAVAVAGGTATVTLTSAGSSPAEVAALVNGLTYQNTNRDNPTAGTRTVTLTQLRDSGGTANGGQDSTGLSIASAVTVVPVNDAPTAVADSYATARDGVLTVAAAAGVLANDSDLDGPSALVALLASDPEHGTLALAADGSFTYTPDAGYVGTDSFAYRAYDGGLDALASVSLLIGTPAPTGLALAPADDTGLAGDRLTNRSSVTVTGTGQAGASVTLFDDRNGNRLQDGGEASLGSATVTGAGTFSATVALAADGAYRLVATQTGPNGTSPASASLPLTRDATAPTVTGAAYGPNNGTLRLGDSVLLTLTLGEAVSLSGAGGLALGLDDGGSAAFVPERSDATRLVFRHTVQAGQSSADLAITGVALNGAVITDAAGNAADLSGAAVNPAGTLAVDTSQAAASAVPAGVLDGTGVRYTVTFSQAVSGTVDAGDFRIISDNGVTGTVSAVTGSGQVYTVTATGLSGTGGFNLDLAPGNDLTTSGGAPFSLSPSGLYALAPDRSGGQTINTYDAAARTSMASFHRPDGTLYLSVTFGGAPTVSTVRRSYDVDGTTLTRTDTKFTDGSREILTPVAGNPNVAFERNRYGTTGQVVQSRYERADGTAYQTVLFNAGATVTSLLAADGVTQLRADIAYADGRREIITPVAGNPNYVASDDVYDAATGRLAQSSYLRADGTAYEVVLYGSGRTTRTFLAADGQTPLRTDEQRTDGTRAITTFTTTGPYQSVQQEYGSDGLIREQVALLANNTYRVRGFVTGETLEGHADTVDTFVFRGAFGSQTVQDFVAGTGSAHDVLELQGGFFAGDDFATGLSQSGANTVLTGTGGQTITLTGVTGSDLRAADFRYV
ncbi:Ig-like domain-containing protein, partial [Methylobacterium crusticola]